MKTKHWIKQTGIFLAIFSLGFTLRPTSQTSEVESSTPVKTLVYHKVKDFAAWKAVFDAAEAVRRQAGELSCEVGTFIGDPTVVYVLNEWTSPAAFKAHMSNPEIGKAMQKGGVLEKPHLVIFQPKD